MLCLSKPELRTKLSSLCHTILGQLGNLWQHALHHSARPVLALNHQTGATWDKDYVAEVMRLAAVKGGSRKAVGIFGDHSMKPLRAIKAFQGPGELRR
eukprot:3279883-Karenia_brevis.AAC.1